MKIPVHSLLLCATFLLAACGTTESRKQDHDHKIMVETITSEQPGDYFIGRRVYKKDYKFWGYIRQPGQQWKMAKLVMLNEKQKFAPDREINQIGSDNDFEYKLTGYFSNDAPVYEPASNGFYPEFVLTGYEVISKTPVSIFHSMAASNPDRRVIEQPY